MIGKMNLLKAFGVLLLFVALGVYILKNSESVFGLIIGYANTFFFGSLFIWGIYQFLNNSIGDQHN